MPDPGQEVVASPSISSDQDRDLVQLALGGHDAAFARLMEKYSGGLRHHILRIVRSAREVDDLVQETFIKAFSALPSYRSSYAFSTWLYRIGANHAIDFLRKKRLPTTSLNKPVETGDGQLQIEVPDITYRPDRHIVADQRRELIQRAIDALPPKYHRVIVLRHREDRTYDEIAKELSLPLGTVKAHIFRARKLLYAQLREQREAI